MGLGGDDGRLGNPAGLVVAVAFGGDAMGAVLGFAVRTGGNRQLGVHRSAHLAMGNANERADGGEIRAVELVDPVLKAQIALVVTSDAHAGLVAAIGATLPAAAWQRCRTHYAANHGRHNA